MRATTGEASPDLAVAVGQASIGFVLASLGPCLVLLARDLAVPLGDLSWLSAGFGVGLLLLGLGGAHLLHLGAGRVLGGSAAALAGGAALLATTAWLPAAKAGALALGLGGAGLILASWALLSGPEAGRRLTRANAVSSLAGICAPPLMGALDGLSGHGRLALLVSVPTLLWVAATELRAPAAPPAPAASGPSPGDSPGPGERARFRLVAMRWIAVVAAVSAEFAFVVWGAARLQESGLSPSAAAACAVAFPVGMGMGRLLAPRLVGRAPLVAGGAVLGLASALVEVTPAPPLLAVAAQWGAGLGIAALFPLLLARLMATPGLGARHGPSIGTTASGVAVLGAPILLNAVAVRSSLRAGFLVAAAGLALVLLLQLEHGRVAQAPGAARRASR